uniref:Glutamate decarboxylase like 1 n=1 Tax=Fundulus heteroclitus TaxID=8078 RepID=A0A3Q2P515_FUNHE
LSSAYSVPRFTSDPLASAFPAQPGPPRRNAWDGVPLNGSPLDDLAAESFLQRSMSMILEEAVKKATDVRQKVCEWRSPEELKELLDLELRDGGESEAQILERCRDAIRYSVKTTHPHFFNQLYAGLEPYSMVASFITDALKPSLYTYEVSPVFTLMEDAVLRKMVQIVGWEEGDGIFNAGGSMSNMYAMNLARYRDFPEIKELGNSAAARLVVFTSQECHYSISKAAALMGIGTKNVFVVPSDKRGKMIPSALEEQIKSAKSEGAVPFIVNATAGTTVLGAFDPIDEIADICEKYKLWLHVDSVMSHLFSSHRANSVAWNPHKMLMACLQCSVFLIRDKTRLLQRCHSARASYLFQQDKFYDLSYDTGDKSVQCSRKPDAFKFWLMWKALGTRELEQRVDRALAIARSVWGNISDFAWLKPLSNFYFILLPLYLQVAPVIKERMMKKGSMMVGYQPHGGKANFFRMVVISPQVSRQDMDFVLDEIHSLGMDL